MIRLLIMLLVLVSVTMATTTVSGDSSFTVPPVSYTTATLPENFISPETHLACLARSELAGSTVTTSLVCYGQEKPLPQPPPPPPPYEPSIHMKEVTGSFDQSAGVVVLTVFDCTVIPPNPFPMQLGLVILLDKDGGVASGSTVLIQDITTPFDCNEPVQYGQLTLTPLALSHDEDGDGCSDWNELDPNSPGGGDPFNPNDCSANAVGGIAELPDVAGTLLETSGSSGTSVGILAGIAATAAVVAVAMGSAAWYARKRWPR